MRRRRLLLGVLGVLALVAILRHPTADIEILAHQAGDPAPHRIQAAIDFGLVAVKFLLTWTTRAGA